MLPFAFLIGIIAGLRAMTAPAAVSWAVSRGGLILDGNILAFMGYRFTPWVFTALALLELVTDKLPMTPSRKVPVQFAARIAMGGLSGGAIGAANDQLVAGSLVGIVGAVVGTFGGAAVRGKLAQIFESDRPAALIEDIVAVGGAFLIVSSL
jgi:uncharacterized membrane protein